MNKAIIIILLILRTIITPFCNLAGRGTKTIDMNERAQLGFTGIYITVLDYKRVYPPIKEKEPGTKKYIAFEVLLDGSKDRTGGRFGSYVGWDSLDSYNTCGIYLEGKIGRREIYQLSLSPPEIVSLFGEDHPSVIGMGKLEGKVASGWVIFELPENFEINKFIYCYHEYSDLTKMLLPEAKVQIIFENPIK
ncbi:hypothetical protein [Caldisericum exile]|uniref:Uncharacterized protein n=1 Tax=Caldisericum exile (strain DSM 21853 / NBRC 104410 / AZM16c01) TaxID=511051 RepID=A0A7U6GD20_CALEA|nr:hypothetical protein [Caldisericum exile]BAL80177.1 hypothetical protein CSE_00510 [Caldisericum exile AZM16c01]